MTRATGAKRFYFGKLDTNHHGTEKKGEPWNKETVRGPKFVFLRLESHEKDFKLRHLGWRVILYFPSGAWWHFDIMKKPLGN